MELTLKIDGKNKKFKSQKITFRRFRDATELSRRYFEGTFLDNDYPDEDMDTALELICAYFGCTTEEWNDGFYVEDSTDFLNFFFEVLNDIQLNGEKRKKLMEKEKAEKK